MNFFWPPLLTLKKIFVCVPKGQKGQLKTISFYHLKCSAKKCVTLCCGNAMRSGKHHDDHTSK